MNVVLMGGPHHRAHVDITQTPPVIDVGGVPYSAITDPDTAEFLGGYIHTEEEDL